VHGLLGVFSRRVRKDGIPHVPPLFFQSVVAGQFGGHRRPRECIGKAHLHCVPVHLQTLLPQLASPMLNEHVCISYRRPAGFQTAHQLRASASHVAIVPQVADIAAFLYHREESHEEKRARALRADIAHNNSAAPAQHSNGQSGSTMKPICHQVLVRAPDQHADASLARWPTRDMHCVRARRNRQLHVAGIPPRRALNFIFRGEKMRPFQNFFWMASAMCCSEPAQMSDGRKPLARSATNAGSATGARSATKAMAVVGGSRAQAALPAGLRPTAAEI
jgi:hypothetical protein